MRLTENNKNDIVYAVFMEIGEFYGDDTLIGLFRHIEDARKFVDAQLYPNWYYVKAWKVK